jgi:hypothetical protein
LAIILENDYNKDMEKQISIFAEKLSKNKKIELRSKYIARDIYFNN